MAGEKRVLSKWCQLWNIFIMVLNFCNSISLQWNKYQWDRFIFIKKNPKNGENKFRLEWFHRWRHRWKRFGNQVLIPNHWYKFSILELWVPLYSVLSRVSCGRFMILIKSSRPRIEKERSWESPIDYQQQACIAKTAIYNQSAWKRTNRCSQN